MFSMWMQTSSLYNMCMALFRHYRSFLNSAYNVRAVRAHHAFCFYFLHECQLICDIVYVHVILQMDISYGIRIYAKLSIYIFIIYTFIIFIIYIFIIYILIISISSLCSLQPKTVFYWNFKNINIILKKY